MEHQSAVTYGNGFSMYNGERSKSWPMYGVIDPLIIHETGHEWFGNSVTASDPTHIWIHEGLQVYSESIYFEDKFNSYDLEFTILIQSKIVLLMKYLLLVMKMKIIGSSWRYLYEGAWIMHTLRSAINNDEIWFKILKEFMVENAKGFANTRDFFNKVEEKTGEDFWYFAEQYFYSPNQPVLNIIKMKIIIIIGG